MPSFAKAIFGALSSVLVACGADPSSTSISNPSKPQPPGSATGAAYAALTSGAQNQVTQVISDVDDAVAKDPNDGRAMFYSAIMRFWQLGEEIDLPSNPLDELTEAKTMVDRFREAQAMLPNDDRAPAFGGLAKVVIGNLLGNSDMRSEGMSDIQHGIEIFPSYSYFVSAARTPFLRELATDAIIGG